MAAVSLLLLACLNPQEALVQDQWVQAGPAGASVATLVVDPSNPSIVYAGLFDEGVYRTADAGAHWTAVNTGLTNLVIRRLAIDPVTPSILYVVTNDGIVYRTTNAGGTWNLANGGLPPPPPQPYTENDPISPAVDPVTPSRLYFSTGPGIYRSTNSGQTWERHDTGLPAAKDGLV